MSSGVDVWCGVYMSGLNLYFFVFSYFFLHFSVFCETEFARRGMGQSSRVVAHSPSCALPAGGRRQKQKLQVILFPNILRQKKDIETKTKVASYTFAKHIETKKDIETTTYGL